jgi:AcrR family transcriptional regulator
MGISERREREREALRTQILEAARDILSEQGLDALSMRAIAERIEYSPATIYLYFRDKDELIREVVREGFVRLNGYFQEAVRSVAGEPPIAAYGAMGKAYARFALESTAYFRVMFELPTVANMECPSRDPDAGAPGTDAPSFEVVVASVQRAVDAGELSLDDAARGAVIGWGLIHGLTSLYLGGHLRETVQTHEQFLELIDEAQHSLYRGWRASEAVDAAVPTSPVETGAATAA